MKDTGAATGWFSMGSASASSPHLFKVKLVESDASTEDNMALEWQVAPSSQPNIFESATPPTDKKRIHGSSYYFSQLNLKMKLSQSKHFGGERKVLRLHYET